MSTGDGPAAKPAPPRFKLPVKVRDATVAVGGMVLGPGVDSLLAEQQANFAEVNTKLGTLRQL